MVTNSGSLSAQSLDRLVEIRLQFLHAKHREGNSRLPAVHVQRMVVWIVSAMRPRGTESQLRETLFHFYRFLRSRADRAFAMLLTASSSLLLEVKGFVDDGQLHVAQHLSERKSISM
jgi:hypothetical protein